MTEVPVGCTRGNRSIDRIFTNMGRSVIGSGTWAPLETDGDDGVARSDHRVAYCTLEIERKETFVWLEYTYRQYTDEAEKKFKSWVVMHEWSEVLNAVGSNKKAEAYQCTLQWAVDESSRFVRLQESSQTCPGLEGECSS